MVTAVGGTARQTVGSVRAGINRYAERALGEGERDAVVMALLPDDWLPPLAEEAVELEALTEREQRMLRLAAPALREAVRELPSSQVPPLTLVLPEAPHGLPRATNDVSDLFLEGLSIQSGIELDRRSSRILLGGRATGLQALAGAMASSGPSYTLVGGVDTYLDPEVLTTLEMDGRLRTEGATDGLAPGEGAGFLLLRSSGAANNGPRARAVVHEPGFGRELGHRYSEEPYRGDGLAVAIAAALSHGPGQPIQTVVNSLNGESFGAKEWGVSFLRTRASFHEDCKIWHPADCFGDAGAAMAPLLVAFAALGLSQGCVPGPCLVWCSSDGELRGAVCVSAAREGD